MKKLLVIAATLAASSAFAGVKLEVRSDYVNTNKYDRADGSENGGSSLFTPSVARLYLNGNVGEAIVDSGWNLRAFDPQVDAATTLNKNMTVDTFVDHLWIGKAMDGWMFKAGKLETNAGGFEHGLDVHGNTYLVSMANGGFGGTATAASLLGYTGNVVNPSNSSGISAAYNLNADNKLELQVTNQTNSQTLESGVSSTDRRHTTGLNWTGSFMEKMLQTNVGYIAGAGDNSTGGHEQTYINAGLRIAPMAALTVDIEYFSNTDKNSTADTTETTDSTIVEARYTTNGWTPVLKYEMSNDKAKDVPDTDSKRTAWAAALEFAPKADEAFRYHVAYTSVKDHDFGSAVAAGDDMTKNMITIGLKYTGEIAK